MFDARIGSYLRPGERLLWTGRPAQGLLLTPSDLLLIPFSLLWAALPGSILIGQLASGRWESVDLMLIFFAAIGFYITVGRFIVDALARACTRYAVTDQRALVLRDSLVMPSFRSLDLDEMYDVELHMRLGGRGTIRFGYASDWPAWWMHRGFGTPAFEQRPQFLAIRDPRRVYELVTGG